jgi:hypothetical protein
MGHGNPGTRRWPPQTIQGQARAAGGRVCFQCAFFFTAWVGPALAVGPWNWVIPLLLVCAFVLQSLPPASPPRVLSREEKGKSAHGVFLCAFVLPYPGE